MELKLDNFPFDPLEVDLFWLDPLFLVETVNRNLQASPGNKGS